METGSTGMGIRCSYICCGALIRHFYLARGRPLANVCEPPSLLKGLGALAAKLKLDVIDWDYIGIHWEEIYDK